MKRLFNLDLLPFFNVEVYPSSSSSKTWSASPATVTASENCYESDVFTESVQAKKKRKRFNMNASTESELKLFRPMKCQKWTSPIPEIMKDFNFNHEKTAEFDSYHIETMQKCHS
ncbi:unnamed protein product [Acanthoscelides obtectus]|uniref:Uncharacterized protein n=1 Tax=Acanthoscelides obtectus TaxID=200917 RepID=A0A9P0KLK3_ACAOB|nr:unnamed protein product [Acanthoscelides obtectus]CAK1623689.1 hypothetical protein AOBTE_LOCUS2121 [Acanthoscelides obtectus]